MEIIFISIGMRVRRSLERVRPCLDAYERMRVIHPPLSCTSSWWCLGYDRLYVAPVGTPSSCASKHGHVPRQSFTLVYIYFFPEQVAIWSFEDQDIVARAQGHSSWVTDVAVDPYLRFIAS